MQINLLKNIISSVVGQSASKIVDLLYDKKNVNEFLIAKKLNLTINQTRNILYKLADEGLVSFVRKKDSKKGGWYTYFWTLNSGKSLYKFRDKLAENMAQMETQIHNRKYTRYFACENCHIEMNEENALINNYTCPECGEPLQVKDSNPEIISLEKEVARIKTMLTEINFEIDVISKKEEKTKFRKIRAEERKKKAERAEKRRIRDKLAGKISKKVKKIKKAGKSKKAKKAKKSSKKRI